MYLEHFHLKGPPFALTPNTHYFYNLAGHQAALNVLMLHLNNGEGFIKVTGKVGSGKTLLCRVLLERLGDHFVTAYIPNPDLESMTLCKSLAQELGISEEYFQDQHKLLSMIRDKLIELHAKGKHVVLLIDEAQALPTESLEKLRLLTNLETQSSKLLQIVLFGQPELNDRLNQGSLRQLKQRITFSNKLPLLKYSELKAYVNHRLIIASAQGKQTLFFTEAASGLLFHKSKGVPRLINILCHKALMTAYGCGRTQVTFFDVMKASKDTESVSNHHSWLAVSLGLVIASASMLYLLVGRV